MFGELGIDGCSSHSGRRNLHHHGGAQRAQDRREPTRCAALGRP
jgi:hypothetical protein